MRFYKRLANYTESSIRKIRQDIAEESEKKVTAEELSDDHYDSLAIKTYMLHANPRLTFLLAISVSYDLLVKSKSLISGFTKNTCSYFHCCHRQTQMPITSSNPDDSSESRLRF